MPGEEAGSVSSPRQTPGNSMGKWSIFRNFVKTQGHFGGKIQNTWNLMCLSSLILKIKDVAIFAAKLLS